MSCVAERSSLGDIPVTETGVVVACFDGQGNVLVVKSKSERFPEGLYGLPAGRMEEGEGNAFDAVVRSLQETTGLLADPETCMPLPRLWVSVLDGENGPRHVSLQVFVCFHFDGVVQPSDTREAIWLPLDQLASLPLLPNTLSIAIASCETYCYCWALAMKEAGHEIPDGAAAMLGYTIEQ